MISQTPRKRGRKRDLYSVVQHVEEVDGGRQHTPNQQ